MMLYNKYMSESFQMSPSEFTRLANNYYNSRNTVVDLERISSDSHLLNYVYQNQSKMKEKFKVAMVCICLNEPYWEYVRPMIDSARKFLLPGHDVDFLLWSDMPPEVNYRATVFETESAQWPLPTLMRYSLFLQQEEKLREYDYIFYCDVDMLFVGVVGDEILGNGITAALHPMYDVRQAVKYPLETNPLSTAYIKVPEFYFAGGFQGGKTDEFIKAMRICKRAVDEDFTNNYMARWNDESHWNKYLFDNPPSVILDAGYIYPDSLIKEYYKPIVWGEDKTPKLMTLTKKFSTSKEGGEAVRKMIDSAK